MINKLLLVILMIVLFGVLGTTIVTANDTGVVPLGTTNNQPPTNDALSNANSGFASLDQASNLTDYLKGLFKVLISFTIVAAIVMLVLEGVRYAASGLPGVKADVKGRMSGIVLGLLLALAAYLILYEINPDLVNLSFPDLTSGK
ncbi:MAG: hypothetical protein AAB468_00785 [Patescibacteria group bacterium]